MVAVCKALLFGRLYAMLAFVPSIFRPRSANDDLLVDRVNKLTTDNIVYGSLVHGNRADRFMFCLMRLRC